MACKKCLQTGGSLEDVENILNQSLAPEACKVERLLLEIGNKLELRLDAIQNGIAALLKRDLVGNEEGSVDRRERSEWQVGGFVQTQCASFQAAAISSSTHDFLSQQGEPATTSHGEDRSSSLLSGIASTEAFSMSAAVFSLRETWANMDKNEGHIAMDEKRSGRTKALDIQISGSKSTAEKSHWFIVRPSSSVRLVWDTLGLVMIATEMLTTPVQLAFEIDGNPGFSVLFWPALLFWTLEIPANFISGYYHEGAEENNLRRIIRRYILTWLIMDIVIVAIDWVTVFYEHFEDPGVSMARMGKTLRILRMFRSLRLLRLMKLRRIIEHLQDHIQSEHLHIGINVFKFIIIILCVNHLVACAWYGISKSIPGATWITAGNLTGASFLYKYFTALHWSLTQFTPASMDVVPHNLAERIYAVIILLFAMIVFSSFISSITSAMTQLRQLSSCFDKNVSVLRRYLRLHQVPMDLSIRIIRYVEHKVQRQKREIQERDVNLIKVLSQPLHMELIFSTSSRTIVCHPFFQSYNETDVVALKHVCYEAMSSLHLSTGDVLFTEATQDDRMMLVKHGELKYTNITGSSGYASQTLSQILRPGRDRPGSRFRRQFSAMDTTSSELVDGDWCSEAALWTTWVHFGTLHANLDSEVLVIHAAALAKATLAHYKVTGGTLKYAHGFVDRINQLAEVGIYSDYFPRTQERDALRELAVQSFAPGSRRFNDKPPLTQHELQVEVL